MNKYIRKLFLFSGINTTKEQVQMHWDETNKHLSASKEMKFTETWNLLAISKLWE